MSSFNKVILVGNLTRDPELRFTQSGTPVCTLGLAVNNPRSETETLFVDINVWNKQAENSSKYLSKGSSVLIEGRMIYRTWEDKNSGQKRGKHEVTAENVQFLRTGSGSGSGGSRQSSSGQDSAPPHSGGSWQQSDAPTDLPDDDIPF